MEKISKILSHDVAGNPDPSGNRVYFEREIDSSERRRESETKFIGKLRRIPTLTDPVEKEDQIKKLASILGKRVVVEINGGIERGKFNIKGIPRAGAFIQLLLIKSVLLGGKIEIFKDPIFIEEFQKMSGDFLSNSHGIDSLIKGAETVLEYHDKLSKEEDVIFIGLNVDLDAKHNIDLTVARTKSERNEIDQIDLVEIKASEPRNGGVKDIHDKHFDFIRGQKEILLNGLGTIENKWSIERLDNIDEDEFIEMVDERRNFLSDFINLNIDVSDIKSWDDIKKIAFIMSTHPMLLAIRLRNVTGASMIHLRTAEKEILLKLKKIIFNISIPSEDLGLYHRLIRNEGPHIGQTLIWKSIVAFKLPNNSWVEDEVLIDNI